MSRLERTGMLVLLGVSAILAFTGVVGWVRHGLTGWPLIVHMVTAPALLGILAAGAFAYLRRPTAHGRSTLTLRHPLTWLAAIVSCATILVAMYPVVSERGISQLVIWHRYTGLLFVGLLAWAWATGSRK